LLLVLGLISIAFGYAFIAFGGAALGAAPWLLATGIPVSTVAIMVMGAVREGRSSRRLWLPFALVGFFLTIGFFLALGLPASESVSSRLFFGLPLRAAIVVYGVGLLPIVILPIVYAITFETQTLSASDLELVRRLRIQNETTKETKRNEGSL
jgi:hypothetical protein